MRTFFLINYQSTLTILRYFTCQENVYWTVAFDCVCDYISGMAGENSLLLKFHKSHIHSLKIEMKLCITWTVLTVIKFTSFRQIMTMINSTSIMTSSSTIWRIGSGTRWYIMSSAVFMCVSFIIGRWRRRSIEKWYV